jgi:chemotaxis protein methyltransferase CheR
MSASPPPASDNAIGVLAALLEARTGQQLAANRSWRIDTALRPLLSSEGLGDLDALVWQLVETNGTALADRVVDALLNQETSFFRDAGVVENAARAVAEAVAERGPGRARIWSAGCSTGQEPLSLAMHFAEAGGEMPELVATDVSAAALERARGGRFSQFEIQRGLPVRRMMRWFDSEGGDWVAKPELVRMVSFRRHNLVSESAPGGRFDAILCRNVLFYLAAHRRALVLEKLAGALRPGGLLVLGAGETVIGQTDRFRPSARFRGLYERAPDPVATPMREELRLAR